MEQLLKKVFAKIKNVAKNTINGTWFGVKITFCSAPIEAALYFIASFTGKISVIINAFILKEIINTIINIRSKSSQKWIIFWACSYIAAVLLQKLMYKVEDYFLESANKKTNRYVDEMLVKKISGRDLSFFDNPKECDILHVINENEYLVGSIVWRSENLFTSAVSLVTTMGIMAALSPWIAGLIAISVIPSLILNSKYRIFIWYYDYEKSNVYRKTLNYSYILKSRHFAEEMRLYNNSGYFINEYFRLWQSWYHEKNMLAVRHNVRLLFTFILQWAAVGLAFVYSVLKFASGKIGVGDIQYYVNITEQIKNDLGAIFDGAAKLQLDSEKVAVIRNFLDWKPKKQMYGSLRPKHMPEIRFVNVGFKYPNTDKWVLRGCSFTISGYEKVALVGLNGAGKSTIVKLLLRFYDPDEGAILIDGIDAREYDLKALRSIFGAVFQDYCTYAMTIRENVLLGDISKEDDDEKILSALKFSGADKLMQGLEKGIDTELTRMFDEKGLEVSGGQKQKIALSRAFFRDADIMILDEPAASLDPEAENEIFTKFIELWKNHGAILISHRLSNVTLCDRIIVLEDGKVAEEGSHKELMELGGRYAHLFNLQASKYKVKSHAS